MTRERLMQLRRLIVRAAKSLSDADAFYCPELFEQWKTGVQYWNGSDGEHQQSRVQDEGVLYRCFQSHVSQADWKPHLTPALWEVVPDPAIEFPEWVQPQGTVGLYALGAKTSHNGKHWISDMDNNSYEPGVYGWHEATEGE